MSVTTDQKVTVVADIGGARQTQPPTPASQIRPTPVAQATSPAPQPPALPPAEYREPRYFGTQREPERPRVVEFITNAAPQFQNSGRSAGRKNVQPSSRRKKALDCDPLEWRGRKVRKMGNRQTYTIKQVFRSGRVELERDWMTYLTDVETIREEYESAL